MDLDLARSFLIALLIGALVGIDRERKKATEPGHSFGGIRTHILLALVGAASARLAVELAMPWTFPVTLAVVGAAVVASYIHQNRDQADAHGLTSEVAAIAVFLLGAMVVVGEPELAVALGVVTSAVLAYKQPLHGAVQRLDAQDLFAGLKLLIASFIVLPLLPDTAVDPWQAINPYRLWLLVILISALSLAGYVAVRWLGSTHGSAVTGLAGGLVSSTATTLSFARSSGKAGEGDGHALAAGILLAWLVMFARVLVLIAVINRSLLLTAWPPIAAMGVVTARLRRLALSRGAGRGARHKAAGGRGQQPLQPYCSGEGRGAVRRRSVDGQAGREASAGTRRVRCRCAGRSAPTSMRSRCRWPTPRARATVLRRPAPRSRSRSSPIRAVKCAIVLAFGARRCAQVAVATAAVLMTGLLAIWLA